MIRNNVIVVSALDVKGGKRTPQVTKRPVLVIRDLPVYRQGSENVNQPELVQVLDEAGIPGGGGHVGEANEGFIREAWDGEQPLAGITTVGFQDIITTSRFTVAIPTWAYLALRGMAGGARLSDGSLASASSLARQATIAEVVERMKGREPWAT